MTKKSDNDSLAVGFASPPCSMHEVDPGYMGLPETTDPTQSADVQRWRTAECRRLIQQRLDLDPPVRRKYTGQIIASLEHVVGDVEGLIIGAYWPIRGEPDILPFLHSVRARGGNSALPLVVTRGSLLVFRTWAQGDPLDKGIWNIPVPTEDAHIVIPDVLIIPVIGFDHARHRLGHCGGYYDRTLGALKHRPRIYGVGYSLGAIATIYPQWHDIPMDAIVTEQSVVTPATDQNSERVKKTGI